MRVLVAADQLAGLDAVGASERIATAFAAAGAQVAVVPLAAAGPGVAAYLRRANPTRVVEAPTDLAGLRAALDSSADDLVVDLTQFDAPDLGRGLLGDPAAELALLRERWEARELTVLVPAQESTLQLTGLSGLAAERGRAAGLDLAQVLAADAEAERWVAELGLPAGPGSGAAGGVGLLLMAMGARLTDPLSELTRAFGLEATAAAADVVVTGAENLDFHSVGGLVVKHVVELASRALSPAIAIVGRNYISARELRLAGFESAYPVLSGPGDDACDEAGLVRVAEQVASTWRW